MNDPANFSRREVNKALLATAFALALDGKALAKVVSGVSTPLFDFAIAGGHYHGLRSAQETLQPGMPLTLRREPGNPYDANAVAVDRLDGLMLGYVPRVANASVACLLDHGRCLRAEVARILMIERDEDFPEDLVFTSFTTGDPMIRLSIDGPPA